MTIVVIVLALAVAFFIAYKLNKKPASEETIKDSQAPEKIEPPIVVKEVKVEEPKKKIVKKAPTKKDVVVKKAVKKTK